MGIIQLSKYSIILIADMNNFSLPINKIKSRLKTDPTEYIFRQEEADECLKELLISIKEWQFHYEMNCEDKISHIAQEVSDKCNLLDEGHRSYLLVHNLVTTVTALTRLKHLQYQQALNAINMEINFNYRINRPEFDAKTYLLKILYLHKIEFSNWLQEIQHSQESVQTQRIKEYKSLKKIRVIRKQEEILSRRWENKIVDTLLIYQFQLIIKMIGQYEPAKVTFLFQKGLKIATKVLGPEHHLTCILKSVTKIKEKTRKLLKTEDFNGSAGLHSKRKLFEKKKMRTSTYSKTPKQKNFTHIAQNRINSILSLPKTRNTSYGDTWLKRKYLFRKETPEMKDLTKITELYKNPNKNEKQEQKQENNLDCLPIVIPSQVAQCEKWKQLLEAKNHKKKGGFILHQQPRICNKQKIQQLLDSQSGAKSGIQIIAEKESFLVPAAKDLPIMQKDKKIRQSTTLKEFRPEKIKNSSKLQELNPEIFLQREVQQDDTFCQLI